MFFQSKKEARRVREIEAQIKAQFSGLTAPAPSPDVTAQMAAVALLQEVQRRMDETQKTAAKHHAAWNPAQVVTQLCLEIETGKYEVKL